MPWITLTAEDLNDYLAAPQVSALRTAALAAGQGDPFDEIMPDVVSRERLKIESCARNRLSATPNSIPPELKWAACYLILEAMQLRIPTLRLTKDQQAQAMRAVDELNRVAACKDVVTAPDDPLEPSSQRGGQIEVVRKSKGLATRESLAGL
ncbi:MAG: hypothetical protein AB1705_22185 [Verrucomicrobiota bacterium]